MHLWLHPAYDASMQPIFHHFANGGYMTTAFKTDPKLVSLLGEGYPSYEDALAELVHNAWDADASEVKITIPPMLDDAAATIVVEDNGSGMTPKEVEEYYFRIAQGRASRSGPKTMGGRRIKGRKGVGKFAGLAVGEHMGLVTRSMGRQCEMSISMDELLKAGGDLNRIKIQIRTSTCSRNKSGTTITLRGVRDLASPPSDTALRQKLYSEYANRPGIRVLVNDLPPRVDDLQGETFSSEIPFEGGNPVSLKFNIRDDRGFRRPGIVMTAGGREIGKPTFFGLDRDPEIPPNILNRITGVLNLDEIASEVAADFSHVVEGSKEFEEISSKAAAEIKRTLWKVRSRQLGGQKGRLTQANQRRFDALPENKKAVAERAIQAAIERLYGVTNRNLNILVEILFDAVEKDDYWIVAQAIYEADPSDISALSAALDAFGFADLASVAASAHGRLGFLKVIRELVANSKTKEVDLHKKLQHSLWIFGPQYSTMLATDARIDQVVRVLSSGSMKARNGREAKRLDLLVGQNRSEDMLLVEFKRPGVTLDRITEAQAKQYRDDLNAARLIPRKLDILLVGDRVDPQVSDHFESNFNLRYVTYQKLLVDAEDSITWLLKELKDTSVEKALRRIKVYDERGEQVLDERAKR